MSERTFKPLYPLGGRTTYLLFGVLWGGFVFYEGVFHAEGPERGLFVVGGLVFIAMGIRAFGWAPYQIDFLNNQIVVTSRFRTKHIPYSEIVDIGRTSIVTKSGSYNFYMVQNLDEFESCVHAIKSARKIKHVGRPDA